MINLKFEIEVLCKELQVDLSTLPIDGVLENTMQLVQIPDLLSEPPRVCAVTVI